MNNFNAYTYLSWKIAKMNVRKVFLFLKYNFSGEKLILPFLRLSYLSNTFDGDMLLRTSKKELVNYGATCMPSGQ